MGFDSSRMCSYFNWWKREEKEKRKCRTYWRINILSDAVSLNLNVQSLRSVLCKMSFERDFALERAVQILVRCL